LTGFDTSGMIFMKPIPNTLRGAAKRVAGTYFELNLWQTDDD